MDVITTDAWQLSSSITTFFVMRDVSTRSRALHPAARRTGMLMKRLLRRTQNSRCRREQNRLQPDLGSGAKCTRCSTTKCAELRNWTRLPRPGHHRGRRRQPREPRHSLDSGVAVLNRRAKTHPALRSRHPGPGPRHHPGRQREYWTSWDSTSATGKCTGAADQEQQPGEPIARWPASRRPALRDGG